RIKLCAAKLLEIVGEINRTITARLALYRDQFLSDRQSTTGIVPAIEVVISLSKPGQGASGQLAGRNVAKKRVRLDFSLGILAIVKFLGQIYQTGQQSRILASLIAALPKCFTKEIVRLPEIFFGEFAL